MIKYSLNMKPLLSRVKLVIFDMDGVLVDSYEVWYKLLSYLTHGFGKKLSRNRYNKIFGQGIDQDRKYLFPSLTEEQIEFLFNIYFPQFLRYLSYNVESKRVLKWFMGSKYKIACCTNTPPLLTRLTLQKARLATYFDLTVSPHSKLRPKPYPDMLNYITRKLCVKKHDVVYIGDSSYDRQSCKKAGILFIGYKIPGDIEIRRLGELKKLLK